MRLSILTVILLLSFFYTNAQDIVSVDYLGQRTQAYLTSQYGAFIQNGVKLYKVSYTTNDVFGVADTASGLFIVPQREESLAYPTLIYQHGTVDGPNDVPSNLQGGHELGLVFGGLGYATLAPDYLGAGESRGFHPYVHADSETSAAYDMLLAVKNDEGEAVEISFNDQLFITGYSQGGHASMALHRYIETEDTGGISVTAASHMSGPYSISGVMKDLILSEEAYYTPAYLPNTVLSYNYVYGIYDDISSVFKEEYVQGINQFFNGEIGLFTLNANLISQLTQTHGAPITKYMLQDSIVDILANDNIQHPLKDALAANDVYQWAPQQPTRLLYCTADDQVNYRNAIVADSVMQALGAVDLTTIDVDSDADHGGCVSPATISTALFFAQHSEWLVDTKESLPKLNVSVFPNPTQDRLFVQGLTTTTDLSIFTLSGQEVLRQELEPDTPIALDALAKGVYMLILRNKEGQKIEKIVIDK